MERLMTALLELTLPMAVVIAVLLAAGPLLGRRFTAKWRYWAWLLIAVRLLLPVGITLPQPVVTLPQPRGEITYPVSREEPAPTEPAPVGDPIQVVPGAAENDPYQQIEAGTTAPTGPSTETPKPAEPAIIPTPAGTRSIPVMEAVGWCWAAGTALFLLWQLGSYLALRAKLSRSRRPLADEAILAVLERESAAAGRQKPLPVYTAAVGSPMIVGAIKPTLLLPEMELTAEQLSLVFRHELIHYRRRDIWYKLLLMLANAIHWFNPMVWLMVYAADRDLELSCDEAVVAGRDEAYREEYGRCLLAVVRAGMSRRTLFTTNFYSGKKTLKNRLATILDTTKKRRGTLALAALLLAAAVAGSLVACTPDGGKNRYNIDLNDMDALSREYLAPLAAMGDIYWSGYQELKSGPLLKYAIYELYGYTGEEKLDLAAAYGTADAEKRAELAKLMDTNYDASGKLPNAQNFYLPQEEVAAAIQKHFDMSPEMADASLKDLYSYGSGYFWVSPWKLGDNLFAYAREATIEGDTLTIRYSLYEAQPGDEGFLAQHMADYTQTHEGCGRYAITIRLEEDGGWKYISRDYDIETVVMPKPEGELQVEPSDDPETADWELIATKAEYYASDTYVFIDGSTEGCRLLGWGQQQVSVYRAEDGYHLSYWRTEPLSISGMENPEVTQWNGYTSESLITPEDAALFNFEDMVIYLNPKGDDGYSLYSPSRNSSIAIMPGDTAGILVEQSDSGLIALNEEASWVFAEGSRYRLFVSYLGMDDADGYNKYNFYLYDSETHHLTTLLENTPYESFQQISDEDDGTLFGIIRQDGLYIYDAAKPEAPAMVYDKTNLPMDGCDAINIEYLYADDRGGDTLALTYFPYNSGEVPDAWNGEYKKSSSHWKVAVLDRNDITEPVRVLTLPQYVYRNYWGHRDMGQVIVRDGLMYYSNYYDENGSRYLPDGTQLWERWCLNLTTGESQLASTNDPTAVSYADEKFIAKAKAMGYTDEMLEIMKASRVSASDILSGTGTGSGSEDFYSPGAKYRAYSRTLNKEYDKSMVVLLDSSGSMRVVPQVWNDMGNYPYSYSAMVDLGFTAEGLLWISDDRGIFYYDPEAIMAVAEDRSPIYSWDPTEMTGGNARLMRVRGRRNDGVTHVYWTPLPENWDRMTQLPEEMTLHVAILDGTGTLQKDWDTGLHLEMYPDGFSWVIALSSRQKEGYAVFAITEPLGRNEMLYQLDLTTGEVMQTED